MFMFTYNSSLQFPLPVVTARQRSSGKGMLSVVCVCLSTDGSHVSIAHNAFDFTIEGPPLSRSPPQIPSLDRQPPHGPSPSPQSVKGPPQPRPQQVTSAGKD